MKLLNQIIAIALIFLLSSCSDAKNTSPKQHVEDSKVSDSILPIITPTSTPVFDTLSKLIQFYTRKIDSLLKLKTKLSKEKGMLEKDWFASLDSSLYSIQQEKNVAIYEYILSHEKSRDNLEGIKYLVLDRKVNIVKVEDAFNRFPTSEKESAVGKWLYSRIEDRKKKELITNYDLSILTLKFETSDGRHLSLSQIPSKYLLLDFWASWCTPCRFENRKLVKEKEDFDKGVDITIVAVSVDVNKERWLKAVKDDGLNYLSICDYKELLSPIAKAFQVVSIPFNVIVSRDGKILAMNLWGDKLKDFIKTLK